jgi:hypothetical protein
MAKKIREQLCRFFEKATDGDGGGNKGGGGGGSVSHGTGKVRFRPEISSEVQSS